MEKRLVVTRSDENVSKMTDITHPILERFAKKCKADFIILSDSTGLPHPHYRIMKLYELLDEYPRILVLDSDLIIKKDCPILFDVVPDDCIGTIFEDRGSRLKFRRQDIINIQNKCGDVGWSEGYINTGVFVVSRCHKDMFILYEDRLPDGDKRECDDIYLGYAIRKLKYKIYELPFQFNHMSMFSEEWNNKASRFDSYIIHYAGIGFVLNMPRHKQIEQDYTLLKRFNLVI
jgi:lipopolysaccharide biosynthesis glycosyltransferase